MENSTKVTAKEVAAIVAVIVAIIVGTASLAWIKAGDVVLTIALTIAAVLILAYLIAVISLFARLLRENHP